MMAARRRSSPRLRNANCRRPFPTSSYMDESSTNVSGWALFDNDCVFRTYTGADYTAAAGRFAWTRRRQRHGEDHSVLCDVRVRRR